MTLDEMKRELAEAERIKEEAHQRARDLAEAIADATCPLKVGQVIPVCGYVHHGKQMRVERIWPGHGSYDGDWHVYGRLLKQDGTDSKNTADFGEQQWEGYQKAAEQEPRP